MLNGNDFAGVSNCYVFKSRLQEYAQKAGISTPVYETVKEGPSHEPCFRSTVIVNNVRYDSLPGFFNRKAAEQSAAEIALMELHKSGNMTECIPQPVHETGLCKNLLQEYAQKMNYAIPSYVCNKQAMTGNFPFICTVEIGGIQYIGAAAKTKKEAEIKAARTALLAIQSKTGGPESKKPDGSSMYTVLPCKKKGSESDARSETAKAIKPKKADFKKKVARKKFLRNKGDRLKNQQNGQGNANKEEGSGVQVGGTEMSQANKDFQDGQHEGLNFDRNSQAIASKDCLSIAHAGDLRTPGPDFNQNEQWISNTAGASNVQIPGNSGNVNVMVPKFNQNGEGISNMGAMQAAQIENSAVPVNDPHDAEAALLVGNSSMGVPAAQGIAVDNPFTSRQPF